MSVLDDLRRLSSAEDFFAYLDVAYDARVLDVARLHILRRMGEHLAEEVAGSTAEGEAALRARCRALLRAAHDGFVASSPLEARLFKVHKDAVRSAQRAERSATSAVRVPLSALTRPLT